MIYIGIDPGLTGAITILDGEVIQIHDLPIKKRGIMSKVLCKIDAEALAIILMKSNNDIHDKAIAVIEEVTTMPKQGIVTNGSLMNSVGIIEGVLAGIGISYRFIGAKQWKKYYGLGSNKNDSRAMAERLFPSVKFPLVKDHNRAESLLLAYWEKEHYNRYNIK